MESPHTPSLRVELQEWLSGGSQGAHHAVEVLAPWVAVARSLGSQLAAFAASEDFDRLMQGFAAGSKWIAEAPQKLTDALATEGLVPHPNVGLAELRRLTAVSDEAGPRAAAEYLLELHEKMIASPDFRTEAQERWQKIGRWLVFSEVLAAYDTKLYSVVIPPALAQAEGVIAHLFGMQEMSFSEFKEKVAKVHEDDFDFFGQLVQKVLDGLLKRFTHGVPNDKLNRHAVMHGGDAQYGTRENAITAIVWADYIVHAADGYKAIAIPVSSDDAVT